MTRPWVLPLILALVVFACFSPSLAGEFVNWDDDANFLENYRYRGLSATNLRWMFTTFHMGNYQPLTWMTLGLDYELWGMNAAGYHVTSLLLHIATTILLFAFLRRLLERLGSAPASALLPAALGALFFAIHPLRVESVAWVTERKAVLCGVFVMLSLLAYLRMERETREGRAGTGWLILSVAMFAGSLLSKALGLMLPFVLLALDVFPLGRWTPGNKKRVLLEKIPFLALALIEGLLTMQGIREAGVARPLEETGLLSRVEEASYGACFYLVKTLLPFNLSPLYPVPRPFNALTASYLAAVAGVVAISGAALAFRRRRPEGLVAWICYGLLLLPLLRLLNDAPHIAADRYTYLACLPWAVLAAFFLAKQDRRVMAGAAVLLVVLGSLTFVQSRVWRNSITLWDHALKVNPENWFAYINRGIARAETKDQKGALEDLDQAVRLAPGSSEAFYNRGLLRTARGDFDGAIADESEAIRLSPEYARAWRGRGQARQAKSDAEGAKADFAEADRLEAKLRAASGTAPKGPGPVEVQVLNNEGNELASRGDYAGAIERYTKAIEVDPNIAAMYNNRGNARASKGDQTGAVDDYTRAIKLDANFAEAYANRGMSRALLGDLKGAIEDYSAALKITPRDPETLANRGVVRAKTGDRQGAVDDFQTALALAPANWNRRQIVESLLVRVRGK